jgi:hypothetical protein
VLVNPEFETLAVRGNTRINAAATVADDLTLTDGSLRLGTTGNGVTADGAFDIVFRTAGSTERVRFGNSGNVSISNGNLIFGTAGNGISFAADANAAGMTSELLDDYEEGSWTPVYEAETGTFTTLVMSVVSATYIKVGRMVNVHALIRTNDVDTTGASDTLRVSGLPFAAVGNPAGIATNSANWAGDDPSSCSIGDGSSIVLLYYRATVNGPDLLMEVDDMTTGATAARNRTQLSITYFTT